MKTPAAVDIAGRVGELRELRGLTQRQLADRVQMDQSAISRLESGHRRVTIEELSRIADALETTVAHLYGIPLNPNRLAAAEWLVVNCDQESAVVRRLRELLELSDLVMRVSQTETPSIPLVLEIPPTGSPAEQGAVLAATTREKWSGSGGPIVDLTEVASALFGLDVAQEPVPTGERGALVQCGVGVDRVLLCLIDSSCHPTEQRASLARLLALATCRDLELLTFDPITGQGSDTEAAAIAERASAFANGLLLPADALDSIDPPALKVMREQGSDAVEAAIWAVGKLATKYAVPMPFVVDLLAGNGELHHDTVRAIREATIEDVLRRTGLADSWFAMADEQGAHAPPQRTADAALAAYEDGLLGIGTLARLWSTDEKTLHTSLEEAGYRPHYAASAFDDHAPTRDQMQQLRSRKPHRAAAT